MRWTAAGNLVTMLIRLHAEASKRCLFCIRPAEIVGAGYHENFWICCRIWGHGTCPRGLGTAVRFIWVDSQALATILDPFQAIFTDLGPDRVSAI